MASRERERPENSGRSRSRLASLSFFLSHRETCSIVERRLEVLPISSVQRTRTSPTRLLSPSNVPPGEACAMTDRAFPMVFVIVAACASTLVWLFTVVSRMPM
jgi:hypothetical protein